jgi:hypothetical protein
MAGADASASGVEAPAGQPHLLRPMRAAKALPHQRTTIRGAQPPKIRAPHPIFFSLIGLLAKIPSFDQHACHLLQPQGNT